MLFNKSLDFEQNETRYLVTPSLAFAPNCQLTELNKIIPQPEAICPDIKFKTPGVEEFMGILVDDPIDLSFLNPHEDEPILNWSGEHLKEVSELLEQREDWQVFYKEFKVV